MRIMEIVKPETELAYNPDEIQQLKALMKNKAIVFESELLKALDNVEMSDWELLNAKSMIDFYLDIAKNAQKVNPKTWEMINDEETRMKAMDKLLKIMTWGMWWTKWNIVINMQNNIWLWVTPKLWDRLLY